LHFAFIYKQSGTTSGTAELIQQAQQCAALFKAHFFMPLDVAVIFSILALATILLGRDVELKRAMLSLYSRLVIRPLYWLFRSNGFPRYIYTDVVISCFTLAMPLLGSLRWRFLPELGIAAFIAVPGLAAHSGELPIPSCRCCNPARSSKVEPTWRPALHREELSGPDAVHQVVGTCAGDRIPGPVAGQLPGRF